MATQRSVRTRLTLDVNDYLQGTARAEGATRNFGTSATSILKGVATGYAAIKLGGLVKESVQLEAAYSKTMAQVAVATEAPAAKLEELDDLALKLGADTVFSAQDAAAAMLELAKGGLSPAEIQAGSLANTLTLASAGGLELGVAANTVVQAMGAFRLGADDTAAAVAALAGAANASSADVSDITQALQQAGTSANAAGFSIQDTAAYLALFADSGIKGSDAGTSLRTMLTRLVPQTKEADGAMRALGLTYLDGNGKLVDATEIAKRTQDAFSGLTDEQRISYGNAIFGADAQRAVNVLTAEGEEGLKKYQKATKDLTQAEKLAEAANSGTAGALEQLSGAVETAQIMIGKGLAPTIQEFANGASNWLEDADIEGWAESAGEGVANLIDDLTPLAQSAFELGQEALPAMAAAGGAVVDVLTLAADVITPVIDGFNKLPDAAQNAIILAGGAQMLGKRMGILPGLAEGAGAAVFGFGGRAERGGEKAGRGAKGFGTLLTNIKGFAALTAVALVAPSTFEQLDRVVDTLSGKNLTGPGLDDSFSKYGKATADTIKELNAAIGDSDVGKYAGDLGIDLDALSASLAEGGSKGEYVTQVLEEYKHSYRDIGTKVGSWVPFLDTDSERATHLKNALEEIAEEYDKVAEKAREQALAVDEAQNAYDLVVGGLGKYSEELKELPTKAVTEILTPGAIKSKKDVLELAKEYELTPDQVETVMDALDLARPVIKAVRQALRDVDGDSATVTLTTLQETIRRTVYEGDSGKPNPANDAFNRPRGGYTGMQVPAGYFGGGIVPGVAPSDPKRDNIFAMGASTGQPLMVRSGEWIINQPQSEKNDRWLRLINQGLVIDDILPGFATGGRYETFSDLTQSSSLDLKRQQQRIRDLERSLKATETVGKGKNKRKRRVLRGLDRDVAQLELRDEKAELAKMRRENRRLKSYGTPKQEERREDARLKRVEAREERAKAAEKAAEEKEKAAQDQKNAIESASENLTSDFQVNDYGSAASLERGLNRLIIDAAAFTEVLVALKEKGASPWLLEQLQKAGPSRASIRVGRQLLADQARFDRINQASSTYTSIGDAFGSLTAGTGTLTAAQSQILVDIRALDVSQVTGEIQRVVRHEFASIANGGNV